MTNNHEELARWAESDMTLPARSTTAERGAAAAEAGRDLLRRAGGRPSLSGDRKESPRRQVRLPEDISLSVDALAQREGRKPAALMRDAITEYVKSHA